MYARNPILNLIIWIFTGFGYWGKRFKHSKYMLTQTQNNVVEAVAESERLKTQLENLKLEIQNEKQGMQLQLNKERSQWMIERETDKARFNIETEQKISNMKLEREQAISKEKFELEQQVKRLELRSDELLTMKKLEFEQKIKQAEIAKDRDVLTIKEEFAKKETKLHQELHKEMYDKLNQALIQMAGEGDKNTRFVHELMLKIFDKAPALNTVENINRNYTGTALPAAHVVEVDAKIKQ